MKRLTKSDLKRKDEIIEALRIAAEAVTEAVQTFNQRVEELRPAVEAAVERYQTAQQDAAAFAEQVAADIQAAIEDHSEQWQESEAGEAAQEWLSEWQSLALDDLSLDFPEDLEEPDLSGADTVEALPDEANG